MTRVLHSFGLRGRAQGCKYTVAHGKAKAVGAKAAEAALVARLLGVE